MDGLLRPILAVAAGVFAFFAVGLIAGLAIRAIWPDYEAAREAYAFTLAMLAMRLAVGAIATIAGGWVAALIASAKMRAAGIVGLALLLLFAPIHYGLLDKFPLWYHAAFLTSLIPLSLLGGRLSGRK